MYQLEPYYENNAYRIIQHYEDDNTTYVNLIGIIYGAAEAMRILDFLNSEEKEVVQK